MYMHNGQVWKVSDDPFDDEIYRWLPRDLQPPLGSPKSRLQQPLMLPAGFVPWRRVCRRSGKNRKLLTSIFLTG